MKLRVLGACLLSLLLGLIVGGAAIGQEEPERIAFLARADNPVDALAASSVAAQFGGVVLLTPSDHLGEDARQGLADYRPDLVILAGGEVALSPQVEQDVKDAGYDARRVGGVSRTDTAENVAHVLQEYQTHLRAQLSGAIFMFPAQLACPQGMTRFDALDRAFPRGHTEAGAGGSVLHTHSTPSHAHDSWQHSHTFSAATDDGSTQSFGSFGAPHYNNDGSGGASYHDHRVSGETSSESTTTFEGGGGDTGAGGTLPPYVNVRYCQFGG